MHKIEYHQQHSGVFFWGVTGPAQPVPVVQNAEPTQALEHQQYAPSFVTQVLGADAGPVEAKFDNVVDLLEWLERD
jgi:hypothetical protein